MLKWIVISAMVLWIIAMWYVIIYAMMRGWGPYVRSKRQPKVRIKARVKNKAGADEFNPLEQKMEFIRKVLVFECEDGVDRDYDVHDDIWDWTEVGDQGELIYQGHLFVGFDSYRPRYDPRVIYQRLTRN